MVYSTIIQTYMRDGGDMYIIGGRCCLSEKFCRCPALINSNSFLPGNTKNVSDRVIIRIKRIYNYLINKANIYLSHIFENIIMIIGKCYIHALCMTDGVQ